MQPATGIANSVATFTFSETGTHADFYLIKGTPCLERKPNGSFSEKAKFRNYLSCSHETWDIPKNALQVPSSADTNHCVRDTPYADMDNLCIVIDVTLTWPGCFSIVGMFTQRQIDSYSIPSSERTMMACFRNTVRACSAACSRLECYALWLTISRPGMTR